MPRRAAILLAESITSAWAWPNEIRLRMLEVAADATDAKSWVALIATSVRMLDSSAFVSLWSPRNELDAARTPDVSPEVEAVKTADTLPIEAMV